jgi:F0F1-type ATP synthase assembly protein I
MDNKQIYKKTLGFSLRRVLWDIISVALLLGAGTLGYFLGEKYAQNGPIGLLIGGVIGIVALVLITRFISYALKAGQIAMMTRGVTEGELPDNVIKEGKKVVKERFATVAAFFAITGVIRGIFNQIGRGITKLGESIGGDTGGAVGSTVSSVMQTIVNYLCDCCLGWVFYRKEVKPARAACEGAVLFFKHGKTFAKNMGRVFGMGLVSLLGIGGVSGGIAYFILKGQTFYEPLAAWMTENLTDTSNWLGQILSNPKTLPVAFAALIGIIVWAIIHSVFIKPFVLVGVLRNYIDSGKNDIPSEESFRMLDSKSAKFRKLHQEM